MLIEVDIYFINLIMGNCYYCNMGKTVFFRSLEESDADLIYEWMNDDSLKQYSVGLNKRICKDEALDWVKARMRHNPYQCWWAICAVDTNKMIGYLSLNDIHYINSSVNFSGIVIGDNDYRDGMAWIESYLFVYEYVFERLNLNRLYGFCINEHKQTKMMREVMFIQEEGVLRQAYFKHGKFFDGSIGAILQKDYFIHKNQGDYDLKSIIKRFRNCINNKKQQLK